ncbi:Signal transduction histidine kinase [Mesonia phycicola]|uniref:histidine kinase n=1 Tax=Mesonia phycicola TaxID=579105 RepID=A0A1M6DJ25_9FLAO|nr:hypothetical protein [Mesonia phycicola]SHI73059.1 Signal transduction histidine kinase [Mesonia phycicola]
MLFYNCKEEKRKLVQRELINHEERDSIFSSYQFSQLDSVFKIAKIDENNISAFKAYSYMFNIYKDSVNEKEISPFIDTLINYAEKSELKLNLAKANYDVGLFYYENGYSYDKAYYYFNKSKKLYLDIEDSLNIAKSMIRMASVQNKLGDYVGSQNNQIRALDYLDLKNEENIQYLIGGYNLLAITSFNQKDYDSAIHWIQKCIDINNYKQLTPTLINNKAMFLLEAGHIDESIVLFNELLNDTINNNSINEKSRVLDNLGYAKLKKGDTSGLKLIREAINLIENSQARPRISYYIHLAKYYQDKDKQKAVLNAKKALARIQGVDDRLEMYKILALCDDKESDVYLTKYFVLNDSVDNARLNATNQFAKIRFDSEINEQKILKLEADGAERALEIEKENSRYIITIIIILFLLIMMILIFIIHKNRTQKNKRLAIYNTENKISKRVHDEVANEVYTLINKLEHKQITSKNDILDHLESIYARSRNISREYDSSEMLENFHRNLNTMLTSFKNENANILIQNSSVALWKKINNDLKLNIYRILQELMTNMKKHSNANVVVISFVEHPKILEIKYSDNGKGFNLNKESASNGINNIKYRISELNGILKFEKTEKGTKMILKFNY